MNSILICISFCKSGINAMLKVNSILLYFITCCYVVHSSEHIVNESCVYLNAAKFLKEYNDLSLHNVIYILNEYYENNNDTLCNRLLSDIISSPNNTFTTQAVSIKTITADILANLLKRESPSIVVFPNTFFFETEMQKLLTNQNHYALSSTCWVIPHFVEDYHAVSEVSIKKLLDEYILINITNLRLDSQVYVLAGNSTGAKLFEVYPICSNSSAVVKHVDDIQENMDVQTNSRKYYIWERRKDLQGCRLPATFIPTSTAFHLHSTHNDSSNLDKVHSDKLMYSSSVTIEGTEYFGTSAEAFRSLMDEMNFTLQAVIPEKKSYGVLNKTSNTWNGIIGVLAENRAEFSLNDLTVTRSRSEVAEFVAPIYFQCKLFIFLFFIFL